MLKINKVYVFEGDTYLFVHSVSKKSGRNIYTVSKVNRYGELGRKQKVKFKRGKFKEAKDVKVKIYVVVPKKDKQKIQWLEVVKNAKEQLLKLGNETKLDAKKEIRNEIAKLAVASIYYQNAESGDCFNLRDFAKGLGYKRYATLYRWVGNYFKMLYTKNKYEVAIKEAADSTIVQSYNRIQDYWSGLYGYNKDIDFVLKKDLKAYAKELKERGLSI